MPAQAVGAYGVQVLGLDDAAGLLSIAAPGLPSLDLRFRSGPPPGEVPAAGGRACADADRVVIALAEGRVLHVNRHDMSATFFGPAPLGVDEVVHPLLALAATPIGHWTGYELFHASAFVADGGVWALLGDKGSGKSTTAAALAVHGCPIVCDDTLVISGTTAFAGPRCVDLRAEAARRLGIGRLLPGNGGRERWRVPLPAVEAGQVMRGWFFLSWGPATELRRLSAAESLRRLSAHRTWRSAAVDPHRLLDFAALPAWELRRPHHWSSMPEAVTLLEGNHSPG